MEEVGVSAEQIGLRAADTILNDDGVSSRYIFAGIAQVEMIRPSHEIARADWFTEATLPERKNRGHILGAISTARARNDDEGAATS